VRQVVAHLVRDWSALGADIRAPLYDWCSHALATYGPPPDVAGPPVLVPGAGLGRLAWQLAAVDGYTVEALESSTVMAAAAHAMLLYHHHHDDGSTSSNGSFKTPRPPLTIHAHAADPFNNEVDSRQRYESCRVPDVNATRMLIGTGRLSYTVAVFDKIVLPARYYGAVVTCFFIDTATTLIDYVSTVRAILRPGGIWINIGPLQWHGNNKVPLAADELRVLLTTTPLSNNGAVFTVLHWSVDETVLNYRDASRRSTAGSTFADGYRPLRFVLRFDDGIRTGS
jgi:carnosine N-methyltransferase